MVNNDSNAGNRARPPGTGKPKGRAKPKRPTKTVGRVTLALGVLTVIVGVLVQLSGSLDDLLFGPQPSLEQWELRGSGPLTDMLWSGSASTWFAGLLVATGISIFILGCLLTFLPSHTLKPLVVVSFLLMSAAIDALFFPPLHRPGVLALTGSLGAFIMCILLGLQSRDAGPAARRPVFSRSIDDTFLILVVSVSLPLGALGVAGFLISDNGAYARYHGVTATVTLTAGESSCGSTIRQSRHGIVICGPVTWRDGSNDVVGTLKAKRQELGVAGSAPVRVTSHVTAYVYRDHAFTRRVAPDIGSIAVLGELPSSLMLALVATFLAVMALFRDDSGSKPRRRFRKFRSRW